MRRLTWFTIGLTAACTIGAYLLHSMYVLIPAAFLFAAALLLLVIRTPAVKTLQTVFSGFVVGALIFAGFDMLYLDYARKVDDTKLESVVITATNYSYKTDYGIACEGKLHLEGRSYQVKLYLAGGTTISPGDTVKGSVRLRFTGAGGKKAPTYHQGSGIFLLAYADKDAAVTHIPEIPLRYFPAVLRHSITQILQQTFPVDTFGFAKALLLGDKNDLTDAQNTALSVSGIAHIAAVSGLHVSILAAFINTITFRRKWLTALIEFPVLFLFAAIAGFTPSVVRACVMQSLMILGFLVNKEYDQPTALSFAVLVMLILNPLAITSVSLQLSAGCTAGIILLSGRIHDYLLASNRFGPAKGTSIKSKLIRGVVNSVSITLGSMVITLPLCAFYFGTVSLIGVITNLLTLWLVTFTFYGIMAVCLLGAVWVPAGSVAAWIISWPIRIILFVAKTLSSVPLAAVYTCSIYICLWLVLCYGLLIAFLLGKKKRPAVLFSCMALGLAAAMLLSWAEPKLDRYRITVFDVGQGQAILLQTNEKHYVVDCGGDSAADAATLVVHTLRSQGVRRLDGLILTHFDQDHADGAQLLLSQIPADALYLPDNNDSSMIRKALITQWEDHIIWIDPNSIHTITDANITLITAAKASKGNESSMCVLFQPDNCDILITGDRDISGERSLLQQISLPDLEILLVGHHGAATSTGLELLHATRPDIAVISAGVNNSYGHPAQQVLDRLTLYQCQIYRTDLDGTIVIRG